MTPDPDQSVAAFRALVCALLDFPEELQVDEVPGAHQRMFVATWADPADQGKLAGRMGCHEHALCMVAHTMGAMVGEKWAYRAQFPPRANIGRDGLRRAEKKDRHDPSRDMETLKSVLAVCLDQSPSVTVKQVEGRYTFIIHPESHEDEDRLVQSVDFNDRPHFLVNELKTLFRAIGGRQGVAYRVQVE